MEDNYILERTEITFRYRLNYEIEAIKIMKPGISKYVPKIDTEHDKLFHYFFMQQKKTGRVGSFPALCYAMQALEAFPTTIQRTVRPIRKNSKIQEVILCVTEYSVIQIKETARGIRRLHKGYSNMPMFKTESQEQEADSK